MDLKKYDLYGRPKNEWPGIPKKKEAQGIEKQEQRERVGRIKQQQNLPLTVYERAGNKKQFDRTSRLHDSNGNLPLATFHTDIHTQKIWNTNNEAHMKMLSKHWIS